MLGKQGAVLGRQTTYSSGLTLWDKKILCSFSTFVSKPWILFSSAGVLFFFSRWHNYVQIYNPYYTHCHHDLWKSWGCFVHFFVLYCILFLFRCRSLFCCGFTFTMFIRIVYKIGGLNIVVIPGRYVISFATLDYWLKPNEYFILWGKGHIYIYIYFFFYCLSFSCSRCCYGLNPE